MAYIYSIINTINQKMYIGQTIQINLYNRIRKHFSLLRNNKHPNIKLQNAFNKYGVNSFKYEIICECSPSQLNELEIKYIKEFDTYKNGYNMTEGGQGVVSEEAQFKNKLTNQSKFPNILKINPDTLEIEEVYPSKNEAAKIENINLAAIQRSCQDRGRIIHGYIYIKDEDYTSNWKPHIRTNAQPYCLIDECYHILCFFESKKDAMRKLHFKKTSDIDNIIKQQSKITYNDFYGRIISITQNQYYEYDIGTCIDYPC